MSFLDCKGFLLDFLQRSIYTPFGASVIAIIGSLIGYFIGNRMAIDRYRIAWLNGAAEEFRKCLYPAKVYMQSEEGRKVSMPTEWIRQHNIAVLEFRNHLSWIRHRFFDRDWKKYKAEENKKEPYPYQAGDPPAYENPSCVLRCLEKLLKHASPK